MKIILTAQSNDRPFCTVTIDGFEDKPHIGVSKERVEAIALDVIKILRKDFLMIELKTVYEDSEIQVTK